ncbi:hypothetical protein FisN_3Lh550 [Fistulifera solaris]|uniref:MCM3-like winged helix domain-containing protein n=1 Tax=Fistulifera solaris TaxID=1519565 RepID=A0A1Z5J8L0_FISSO|nr:hypothetical protein FisN_3Lh550 [Fistulifera solaris]|eukprot:GAX10343.1 hypothetical protein FisN_3Lh550 [Fistulifera solaris]
MNVSPRTLAKGTWEPESGIVTMNGLKESLPEVSCDCKWHVGQLVEVAPRTWPGQNRPGGHGRITHVHVDKNGIFKLDIKYIIGVGTDLRLDEHYVTPYQEPTSRIRSRRQVSPETVVQEDNKENKKGGKRSRKDPSQQRKKNTDSEQSKRTLNFPALRPKKKAMKKSGTKRQTADPTEALSEDVEDGPHQLSNGIPREIACEEGKNTFLSPLNDFSKLNNSQKKNHQTVSPEDVFDGDSLSSVGEKYDDDMQDVEQAEAVNVASKSPISRTKPLMRGDLNTENVNVEPKRASQPMINLERIQQAQIDVARKFVDEVVHHKVANDHSTRDEACSEEVAREQLFDSCLIFVFDMNDQYVSEEDVLRLVNERRVVEQSDAAPFKQEEVEAYLESLVSKNRIMKADGMVFFL